MRELRTLPTFLGIGVQKSGTTWLYQLLKSHDEIYMPEYRKELHFFDSNYSKGSNWYKTFFPDSKRVKKYKEVGEFTPSYIYNKQAPKRIKDKLPDSKFIVILRNPKNRLISSFKYYKQRGGKNDFSTFSRQDGDPFKRGLYSTQIKHWFKYFDKKQFLILIFEDAVSNPAQTKKNISNFFNLSSSQFSKSGHKPSNESFPVRFKKLYLFGVKTAEMLREQKLDLFINYFNSLGLKSFFHSNEEIEINVSEDQKYQLMEIYMEDIYKLEQLVNCDFSLWKKNYNSMVEVL